MPLFTRLPRVPVGTPFTPEGGGYPTAWPSYGLLPTRLRTPRRPQERVRGSGLPVDSHFPLPMVARVRGFAPPKRTRRPAQGSSPAPVPTLSSTPPFRAGRARRPPGVGSVHGRGQI